MFFQSNFNQNSNAVGDEIRKICEKHPECRDCPLKGKDCQINNVVVRCDTGKQNT